MHVRIAEQKWIHAKNSDDSINDIMFMFCHHRSNTMYKLVYKLSMFFAIHRWNFGFFHFTSFIYDIPTSIDIQKLFGCTILPKKRDADTQID